MLDLRRRAIAATIAIVVVVLASACRGITKKEYEYEEELYLDLDGSATLYVNASVPALVALRGVDLDVNPAARLDRRRVRAIFEGPGVSVRTPTSSRRHGRRFVHVRVDADRLADLQKLAPFAWSTYSMTRRADRFEFRQVVGAPSGRPVGDVGWTGRELVAFRMHLPSRIPYHNAPSKTVERGNILEWEQPLAARLQGVPVDIQAHMATESILYSTLLLFGTTIVAAAGTLALVIWWIARKGRGARGEGRGLSQA
jgi:hypothetical protein